ncbi:hypothetical protein K474DRAFT_1709459 [Panus rudis PR-1116 ss-1]|nr:hypothetical protein K474DRAFT_1709459 [Panus rudis PR-1116 ss-1]
MSPEPATSNGSKSAVKSKADLPPPREGKGIRSVSPPLSNTPLHRFNYYIALLAVLLLAIYSYRLLQWKANAGGWWNLALGKRPPIAQTQDAQSSGQSGWKGTGAPSGGARADLTVEQRIEELASALGMPSKDLASAIAGAVREFVPPATLSSVSASQTGEAVSYLVDPSGAAASESESAIGATATKGFKVVASAFEAAVGMDEPPVELA